MMEIYHSFSTPLQKSIFLDALRAANETPLLPHADG